MDTNLSFVAIDFETANSDYSSICQVGLAFFENGVLIKEESQLINPEMYFDGYNVNIHKIKPEDVEDKPTLYEYYPSLCEKISGKVVIHHQPFDFCAFSQACDRYTLNFPSSFWMDNAAVVRRTWPQFQYKGYGLKNVAKYLGIDFKHHDACEDARTAGLIFIEACNLTGKSIQQWSKDIRKRIKAQSEEVVKITVKKSNNQKITGDLLKADFNHVEKVNNLFFGKKVVISGTYENWPDRKDLARVLKGLGADIDSGVTEKTNILCAGKDSGPKKLVKMHINIDSGKEAMILSENDIIELLIDIETDICKSHFQIHT